MGCLLAAQLARQKVPVTLLLRSPPAATNTITIELQGVSGDWSQTLNSDASAGKQSISHLLVMTKAYDVAAAVATVAHRLHSCSVVLLMSNGIGFADEILQRFPLLPIVFGTTTEGSYRRGPWLIQHAGHGATRIGIPGQRRAPDWFDDWHQSLPACQWDPDITVAQWRKLAINCVINPLTALHGCRNGELADNRELSKLVIAMCREVALIGAAAGQGTAIAELERVVFNVIRHTAQNRSSMLQDIEAGRHTEIDYINGYAVRVATQHGVDTPLNRQILQEVRELERRGKPGT